MKFLEWAKDGGEESHVEGFFFVEIKPLFSIVLLHFANGTREAYHNHAFNALTWFLSGEVDEHHLDGRVLTFKPSFKPKYTKRSTFHKVFSKGDTWALSFRGAWANTWKEFIPSLGIFKTLTHGRKEVEGFVPA